MFYSDRRSSRSTALSRALLAPALLGAVALAAPAYGGNYYFDASAPAGGAGTQSSPWNTLSIANSLDLNAGDHVYLEGKFNVSSGLSLTSQDAGTASKPVVITSYGSSPATINAGDGFGLRATNVGGIDLSNLRFTGSGHTASGGSARDGSGLYTNTNDGIGFYANEGIKQDHIRIDNVYVAGFGENGISLHGERGKSGFNDVRITNSVAEYNQRAGVNTDGDFNGSGKSAHTNVYVGSVRANNNAGRPNRPDENNSGSGIILGQVNGATIENSVAYANGTACASTQGGAVGIWAWDANNVTIQHNESYGNGTAGEHDGGGFDLDGGVTNSVMQDNYSHDNDGAGYLLAEFPNAKPFGGNVVRNNVSENDGRKNGYGGIHAFGAIGDTTVSGNTVIMNPAERKDLQPDGKGPAAVKFRDGSIKRISFKDNLFVITDTDGSTQTIDPKMLDLGAADGASFDGNAYWRVDGSDKTFLALAADSNPNPSARGADGATPAGNALSSLAEYVLNNSDTATIENQTTPPAPNESDLISDGGSIDPHAAPAEPLPEPAGAAVVGCAWLATLLRRRRRDGRVGQST
jgi:parallel beta-helix repeat protein